jgi:hypothetical protein
MLAAELRQEGDAAIREITGDERLLEAYELATNYRTTVGGSARYFRKRRG